MAFNGNVYGGMTLKALLENPDLHRAPTALSGAPHKPGKKDGGSPEHIDFTSAFLGPNLWDKTYEVPDFNLEYMDLDEFLSENGIPVVEDPAINQLVTTPPRHSPHQSPPLSPHGSLPIIRKPSPPHSPPHAHINPASMMVPPAPAVHGHHITSATVTPIINPRNLLVTPKMEKGEEPRVSSPSIQSTGSTPPISPLPVHVDFKMTEQDAVLASVPGQGLFDPTQVNFSEEELKPQPMIKKSKKIFVPEDLKDDRYWARRKKNNYAAKRSRDARRIKENQIAMRAAYLEKENSTLKDELDKMRRENIRLKHRLGKYENGGMTPSSSSAS